MIRTLENLYLDGVPKTFKGYVDKDFYLHGYAPYFDLETMKDILTSLKEIDDARDYETKWKYDKKNDTFIYEDVENGYGKERYKGEDVETEDGIKHLYPTGEWMWEIEE